MFLLPGRARCDPQWTLQTLRRWPSSSPLHTADDCLSRHWYYVIRLQDVSLNNWGFSKYLLSLGACKRKISYSEIQLSVPMTTFLFWKLPQAYQPASEPLKYFPTPAKQPKCDCTHNWSTATALSGSANRQQRVPKQRWGFGDEDKTWF